MKLAAPAAPPAPVTRAAGAAPPRRLRPVLAGAGALGLAATVVALLLTGGAARGAFGDPGAVVRWGLPVTRLVADLAAALTVGALLVPAALLGRGSRDHDRVTRVGVVAAATWSVACLGAWVLTVCDTAGLGPRDLDAAALGEWGIGGQAGTLLLVAAGVGALSVVTQRARSRTRARWTLAVALLLALPVSLGGHTSSGTAGPGGPVGALAVHVLAALVWTGGLAGLLLLARRAERATLATAAARFSTIALGSYLALLGSGLLAATTTLPGGGLAASDWTGAYAGIVLAKAVALLLLGLAGQAHRRRTLPRLAAGRPGAFVRLAAAELLLMGAAMGLAAALSRTAPPGVDLRDGTHGHGTLEQLPALSASGLVTTWRLDAVVVSVLVVLAAAYLSGVRRLAASGIAWPRRRTLSLAGGLAFALVVTSSGLAVWSPVLLSIHLAQLYVALLVVPALLLLARPLDLARACGLGVPAVLERASAHPLLGATLAGTALVLLVRTGLLDLDLASPWWHLLVLVVLVCCGMVLLAPTLHPVGVAAGPERAGGLLVVAGVLGLLAVQLLAGDRLLAAGWFLELRLGWIDPAVDQRTAGLVTAGAAVVVAALALLPARRSTSAG